ncbi:phosphatidate cytidylyltransferase [Paenibacillus crassostreae]|uniref:Phosphatidate cytidylyltransferase n=1 Tax=Paenibacillus crassostreae TaxID=1763538 RepID=A0A167FME4_9BACL|nr:phosphatidate cytidylyltransferase [Paenibacillus crassostreae]AOZ94256.1 phosphatidate cytidylyltransferase [Paenibacillus crassostreae]OAB76708.1 phosphatidate cytidylyltransferase [Paenibacillus crassostreae]
MKQRLITGIIAGIFFLGLCVIGNLPFHILVLGMALIGYYEFVKMIQIRPFSGIATFGFLGVFIIMFPWKLLNLSFTPNWEMIWILMFLFMLMTVLTKNRINIKQISLLLLGVFYIGSGFYFIAESRNASDGYGLFWTFLLLFSIWASDAGAYFVGKRWGHNKLWPAISPNKTVEGAIGGIIIAVLVAIGFAACSGGILGFGRALLIGLACAVIGQLGDLMQSAYKRVYNIKDSGRLLPGHGGILDRCDSWVIVFPFVHIMMLMPY